MSGDVQYDQDIVDLLASLKPGSLTTDGGLYAAALPPPPTPPQHTGLAVETSEVGVHCKAWSLCLSASVWPSTHAAMVNVQCIDLVCITTTCSLSTTAVEEASNAEHKRCFVLPLPEIILAGTRDIEHKAAAACKHHCLYFVQQTACVASEALQLHNTGHFVAESFMTQWLKAGIGPKLP